MVSTRPGSKAGTEADSLVRGFAMSARRYPHRVAVRSGDQSLTYAELDALADALAARIRARAGRGDGRVAILLERSADLVVSALAVLKAGSCYVPLDPASPASRLRLILAEAEPDLVITSAALAVRLPEATRVLYPGDSEPGSVPGDFEPRTLGPDSSAYVIFTSGTTGQPKGAQISHGNVLHLFEATRQIFGFGPEDVWSVYHSIAFDFSVWEMWGALLHGSCAVIVPAAVTKDPAAFRELLRAEGVTVLSQTPTAFSQLTAEEVRYEDHLALRYVVFGGERLRFADLEPWIVKYGDEQPQLINMYGITETTVHASYRRVRRADIAEQASLIGHPLPGYEFVLVGHDMVPVAPGAPGEIIITGPGVGLGYLGRPVLTRERFVQVRGSAGRSVRGYRSGDVARCRDDGDLEFLGRNDDQVKIRGFRIELGEVEAALARHPAVHAVAVAVRPTPAGEPALVGYVIPASDSQAGDLDSDRLRGELAGVLPDYMVPIAFKKLAALPMTPNGKLDRAALPGIAQRDDTVQRDGTVQLAGTVRGAPASLREELMCELFAQALGRPFVAPDDDFFALGGHSLTAIRLINRIRALLGMEVSVQQLFDARTVRELARQARPATSRPSLTARQRDGELPLSHAQRRLWFLHQIHGATPANHLPYALHLSGPLDTVALTAAISDVVRRHEVLRTVYPERDGVPSQRILSSAQVIDPLTVTRADGGQLDELVRDHARRSFDLATDVPLRATLFVTGQDQSVLLLVLHHIAADGWSLDPLLHDLAAAYTARLAGSPPAWAPLPVQYGDYALWQGELLGDVEDQESLAARQVAFWTEYLRDAPEELDLPADRARPHAPSFLGGRVELDLGADLHERLVALAQAAGTTLTMVLQAAVAALLTRLGAGTDLPLGVPAAGRADESLHSLVGFFVNTIVTRVDTSGDPSFAELLRRVRATSLAAYDHQDLPFEWLVEILRPKRSPSRHPLTQVMVGTDPGVPADLTLPGLTLVARPVSNLTAKFDLAFRFQERLGAAGQPQGVAGALEYSSDLFGPDSARMIAERLPSLLREALSRPDLRLSQTDILGDAERRLLSEWNDTGAPLYDAPTAGRLIERQTDRAPDAVAIIQEGARWTYRELDTRANQIAHLLRVLGAGAESMVALCLSRGPWFVAAMLGVWKAGAAYTPLETRDPAERLAFMICDSGAEIVLTEGDLCDHLPLPADVTLVRLDCDPRLSDAPVSRPPDAYHGSRTPSQRLAYAVYTSGSTGKPKCVLIEHRGVLCRLRDVVDQFRLDAGAVNLQIISLGVEVPVREICGPLLVGGAVAMLPAFGERDPGIVIDNIRRIRPTLIMCMVHSLLESLLAYGASGEDFSSVGVLGTGGEVLRPAEAEEIMNSWDCEIVNQYGPTETTMMCTQYTVHPEDLAGRIPIGRPLANTQAHVLDDRLAHVPVGVTGEVYLSGICVGRGFLGRPSLTAERFVADPFGATGTRMYRSGDLARWRPDGNLEFVGRVDGQVRIRGFRVELGEIETVLISHPKVAGAVVAVREVGSGDRRLAAYVVPSAPDDWPAPSELRDHLVLRLPDQMIPTTFTVLEKFPLLSNGKMSRALLPEPDTAMEIPSRRPRTPHEEVLCSLFAEVLRLPAVGVDHDFFQLGGHSLLGARLIGRIRATLGIDVAMRTLFEAPTVAALAQRLSEVGGKALADHGEALEVLLPLRSGGLSEPLFCIHPGGGLSWGYAKLLRHIKPDIPIYGVQAHGLLDPDQMPQTIEEMAARYRELIRTVQPEGPYYLLGWSLGGVVAFDMAVQLQALGEPIGLLALLDSYPGVPDHFRVGDRTMLRSLIDPERADAVPAQGSIAFETAMEIIRQDTGALGSLTEPQVANMLRAMAHNRRIVRDYQPGFFDGDLLFFLAAQARVEGAPTAEVWKEYISGEVTSHPIEATHIDMLDPEPAARIGCIVNDKLAQRQAIWTGKG